MHGVGLPGAMLRVVLHRDEGECLTRSCRSNVGFLSLKLEERLLADERFESCKRCTHVSHMRLYMQRLQSASGLFLDYGGFLAATFFTYAVLGGSVNAGLQPASGLFLDYGVS